MFNFHMIFHDMKFEEAFDGNSKAFHHSPISRGFSTLGFFPSFEASSLCHNCANALNHEEPFLHQGSSLLQGDAISSKHLNFPIFMGLISGSTPYL